VRPDSSSQEVNTMNRRPRSRTDKLLLGVLGLTAILLVTSLVLALKPDQKLASGVVGTVIASPCRPVEMAGDPPCPGHEGELRVLRPDGSLVTTSHTDQQGHFRIELPPGRYLFDPGDGGYAIAKGGARATVRENVFTRIDLFYYTGIQ